MSIPQKDVDAFEIDVSKHFSFLETDFNLRYAGINTVDDDPRDSYVVAKYRQGEFRINIAWDPFEMSLNVLVRLDNEKLGRREKYVHLEPFIEFTSDGEIVPIVPQIYPGMSVGMLEKAMQHREELFARGVEDSLRGIASRLQAHLPSIRSSSAKTIRDYHAWYQSRGKACPN